MRWRLVIEYPHKSFNNYRSQTLAFKDNRYYELTYCFPARSYCGPCFHLEMSYWTLHPFSKAVPKHVVVSILIQSPTMNMCIA